MEETNKKVIIDGIEYVPKETKETIDYNDVKNFEYLDHDGEWKSSSNLFEAETYFINAKKLNYNFGMSIYYISKTSGTYEYDVIWRLKQ